MKNGGVGGGAIRLGPGACNSTTFDINRIIMYIYYEYVGRNDFHLNQNGI